MLRSYLALFVAVFVWSSYYIPLKHALQHLHPVVIAFLAALMASLFFWITGTKEIVTHLRKKPTLSLLGVGVFGTFAFNFLMNTGLKTTQVINAAFLLALLPIFGMLVEFFLLKKVLHRHRLIGLVFSLAGAFYLLSGGSIQTIISLDLHTGDLLVTGAVLSLAFHAFFAKKARAHHSARTVTAMQLTIGTLLLLPFALANGLLTVIATIHHTVWLAIAYVGLVRSTIASSCYNYALKQVDISAATIINNTEPLLAALLAVFLLGEQFTTTHLIAGGLILGGVVLAMRRGDAIFLNGLRDLIKRPKRISPYIE